MTCFTLKYLNGLPHGKKRSGRKNRKKQKKKQKANYLPSRDNDTPSVALAEYLFACA